MAQNMYRVGDFVYFEVSSAAPYQVRKIEELNKTPSGNVEAKVSCFCRRRDLPTSLLKVADRAERVDKIVNTRRRLVITPSAPVDDINGDLSPLEGTKKGDESSSENGQSSSTLDVRSDSTVATAKREESESPKPMYVDTGDDDETENENKSVKETDEKENELGRENTTEGGYGLAGLPKGAENLTPKERHVLRQHELFLTRQIEALPATHIRGKCTVTLLSEVETAEMYLNRDDAFFYSLVYDPTAMTLLADKGEIRVGEKYQCEVPDEMATDVFRDESKENGNLIIAEDESEEEPVITTSDREVLVYHPHHNLTDRDIDQFLIVARAVGTFSRALDTSSSMKLPSLHMTAAAASRDVTLFHAMALLHQANYEIGQAVKYLVPPPSKQHYPLDADKTTSHNTVSLGGPILCRDQMEEWSAAEANLFEESIEKYGKDFGDIRADYLPWKSIRDIVEYYYMWKTTNRYIEIKKNKAVEQESKLKQVYIPNYNKPNPNLVGPPNPSGQPMKGTSACESCQVEQSTQWYAWGPAQLQLRLCSACWSQWKKYGGLKRVHEYESYDIDGTTAQESALQSQIHSQKPASSAVIAGVINRYAAASSSASARNGISGRAGSGQVMSRYPAGYHVQQKGTSGVLPAPVKTRVAFYLNTTLSMRIARRLAPKSLFNIRRSARRPFLPINGHAIKQYCTTRQPLEIIRAAKQIKVNKLSDTLLAQLAASIIASGAQFTQAAAVTANQKRHGTDKGGPPIKRQAVAAAAARTAGVAVTPPPPQLPPSAATSITTTTTTPPQLSQQALLIGIDKLAQDKRATAAAAAAAASALVTATASRKKAVQPDSRWTGADEKLLFLAGPRLKLLRKRICPRNVGRHIALHPCRSSDLVLKQWPNLQGFFI